MKLLFTKGPSLIIRLMVAVLLSSIFIFLDLKVAQFKMVKNYLNNAVEPIQVIANTPSEITSYVYNIFKSKTQLLSDNASLRLKILKFKANEIQIKDLINENNRLRRILESKEMHPYKQSIAEVMDVTFNSYVKKVLINKGSNDGVYVGQAVVNSLGVVGQIVSVSLNTSTLLLLDDPNSAIPAVNIRNDMRVILSGYGKQNMLQVNNVLGNSDIKVGDELYSSGLGNKYPRGYPIGRVISIGNRNNKEFADIKVQTFVHFNRLHYVLLLWNKDKRIQ